MKIFDINKMAMIGNIGGFKPVPTIKISWSPYDSHIALRGGFDIGGVDMGTGGSLDTATGLPTSAESIFFYIFSISISNRIRLFGLIGSHNCCQS